MANEGYIIFKNRRTKPVRSKPVTAHEYLRDRLAQRPEAAAMDRAKLVPRDEKARIGVDLLTRDLVHDEHVKGNTLPDVEAIRKEAEGIAEIVENKRSA